MRKALFPVFVIAIAMTSCLSEDVPIAAGSEICTVINPTRLLSDGSIFFNVQENAKGTIPDTLARVMIDCDILSMDENEYNIRIRDYAPVRIHDAIIKSGADQEALGKDGINATSWIGGGYINAAVTITGVKDSKTDHSINLEFDDLRSGPDTLYFKFRHNAFGESLDNPGIDASKVGLYISYHSFPFESFVPDNVDSIIIQIENEWFVAEGGILTEEKKLFTGHLEYVR